MTKAAGSPALPDEELELLRQAPLLGSLSDAVLRSVAGRMKIRHYLKGEPIYRVGEAPECLYILRSGRVQVHDGGAVLSYLGRRGDMFGESSLLTGEPHSVNIIPVLDSEVYCLHKADFDALVQQHPAIALGISKVLSQRLRAKVEGRGRVGEHIQTVAVYSSFERAGSSVLAANLAASIALETEQEVLLWDCGGGAHGRGSSAQLLRVPGPAVRGGEGLRVRRWTLEEVRRAVRPHDHGLHVLTGVVPGGDVAPLLALLEERYPYIVVDLPHLLSSAAIKVMGQAERSILLVTSRESGWPRASEDLKDIRDTLKLPEERLRIVQVCLEKEDTERTADLARTVGRRVDAVLTYDRELIREFERTGQPFVTSHPMLLLSRNVHGLARDVIGRKVGLALGSGTARGFAHIGVLKALQQANIPIDLIAGSSMGAYIGAIFAAGHRAETIEYHAVRKFPTKWRSLFWFGDLHLSRSGLISGIRINNFLRTIIGDPLFSELEIPFAVVATDLKTGLPVVLREGSVLEAVRASMAFPGMIAPVLYGGRPLVDGGVTVPVPVEALRTMGATTIIAVDVIPPVEQRYPKQEIEILLSHYHERAWRRQSLKRLFRRLRDEATGVVRKPFIMDVIFKSVETMQCRISAQAVKEADVVIRPQLAEFGMFDFHRVKGMVREGERATEEAIPHIRARLVGQQQP